MASDHGGRSPHGSDYMDEQAFTQYLEGDLASMTDADSENIDHDMEMVQSPAEPFMDENVAPTIELTNAVPQETRRSGRLPFVIPDGAEVVDLDMLDDNSFVFVSEVPDLATRVKEEPVETRIPDIGQHSSVLPDGTERFDTSRPTKPGRGDPAGNLSNDKVDFFKHVENIKVKNEYGSDSPLEFVWSMDMTKEQIIISDDEDDEQFIQPSITHDKSRPDVAEPVTSDPIPPVKKLLITKKPKESRPQLTNADKVRMMAIQAKLAATATGRPITGGLHSASVPPAGPSLPAQPADPHAWMVEEVEDEDNDGAAEKFETFRRKYIDKQRCGKASFEDDVNFKKAEKAERARLMRLEHDTLHMQQTQAEIPIPGGAEDEEDELFFPFADSSQTQNKRQRDTAGEDASRDDEEHVHKRSKHGPREKHMHSNIRNKGMLAAVEDEIAKNKAGMKKGKAKPNGFSGKKAGEKKKPSMRKPKSGAKVTGAPADKPKSAQAPKKPRAKGTKAKAKAAQPTLLNVNSLLHSNVYAEANAGHNSAPIPSMTEKVKADALKQLIASVPLEDQQMANREKEHIRKATIQLGKNRVKANGKGGWAFKGLISSLTHHQVQGAAWMRERELGLDEPLGGIVADEMGFGKTIQMLACMVANPPPRDSESKVTLIVATHALCLQWAEEIAKHVDVDRKVLGTIVHYHRSSRLKGVGAAELLQSAGVILTTYSEVLRSYPKYKPPKELMTHEKRMDWWKGHYDEKRGVLHKIPFFRVVLDEAHAIKNHLSQTSIACRGLVTKRRWAMTGTPIQNFVEELYPYFKFLHVKHTGSFEVFKENFCDKSSGISNERLHSFLRQFLIRRTHSDRLFGAPLITLPKNNEKTVYLDFNEVERAIYEIVRHRFIKRINEWKQRGVLEKSYSSVLTMLLRLRQLTAHVFLLQETIEDLVELEDVERLWRGTAGEVETAGSGKDATGKNMLIQMRKMITDKGKPKDNQQGSKSAPPEANEDDAALEESQPLIFRFRKYLRSLAEGSKWDDIAKRSLCHKCRDVPTDPHVTDCLHIYCKECLRNMTYEAAQDGEDYATCLECGSVYSETRPCSGLKELGYDDNLVRSESGTPASGRRPKRNQEDDTKWVSMEGGVLPSTKSTAMVVQVEEWLKEDPTCKIIIFTQWHLMIKIIGRVCESRGWGHCAYHGKMTHEARAKTIEEFRNKKSTKIMVASLKCGGVGLNLTCASRVINIDLFWNSSVEMQAFCRVFRIGQDKETFITRFVIRNTVDEKLKALQEEKKENIDAAIGDDGKRLAKLSLQELLRLFGPVRDEDGKEFILVDDEDEYADTMPTIANEHEDNVRPFEMSSLADAILSSDNIDPSAPVRKRLQSNGRKGPRSSPRPQGPPSESNGHLSDAEGFPDDEVVGVRGTDRNRPRNPMDRAVPKVTDEIGERVADVFEEFLDKFVEEPSLSGAAPTSSAVTSDKYYVAQIHGLRIYNLSTLYVDFQHLMSSNEGVLANAIAGSYYRFLPFLTKALHSLIAKYEPRYFREHRQPTSTSSQTATTSIAGNGPSQSDTMGEKTMNQQTDKLFTLAFYNLPLVSRIRQLRTASIGKLLSISGTVTRTSEVRPELYLATFICENCRAIVPNVEQIFRYTEPTQCPNLTCGNRQGWRLDIRQSTFVDWQKVRIQENSSEIPTGSMPRTMDVILRGEIVDRAKAGEKCIFTGALIVVPDVSQLGLPGVKPEATRDNRNAPRGGDAGGSGVTGLKALGVRDLTYRMAFLACMVTPDTSTPGQAANQQLNGQAGNILASLNQTAPVDPLDPGDHAQEAYLQSLTAAEIEDLKMMVHSDHIYSRLVNSLAPMVYGHEIVKKGLLLQLMGGVSKVTPEGMQLRGDLNICIVGDPSTSKSQFLKYICSFLPRAVYTSGKASSAAGLTAAVVKDEETGEFTIEAGALMLADNGICAIDEFDKMDIADQVAIHEAMEQQTISIAKAGIQATLNARTSILAAANPVGGRYNRKTTLRANINMSAPIMSRFDLFFVILDECNESVDRHLAEHIVNIHRLRDDAVKPEFSTEQLQRYIRFARTFKPEFTEEARVLLVEKYKELRADDAQGGIGRNSYRITVRQLESMIRLSEAIAKANCVEDVTPNFVREAFNLLRQSIISVEKDDVEVEDEDEVEGLGGAGARDRDGDSPMDDGGDGDGDGDGTGRASTTPAPGPGRKTKITYDKYMAILNLLVRRVNEDELTQGEGVEQEELVVWYLEQKEEELNTQEELEAEGELVRKVLRRMVKDNIFMQIRGEGLVEDGAAGSLAAGERVVYVLHPNCAVEEV